jgi:hypothetical protein
VVPEQIGGYPLPHGGQFGPSKPSLDPAVFDRDERMHPWVRLPILSLLGAFWDPRHQGWQTWARVYLAGSMASYWWGTPDCDVLIGVDVGGFNRYNPVHAQPDNETLARYLTDELRTGLDPLTEHFAFPPSPDYRVTMGALGATPLPIEAPPGTPPLGGDGMEVTLYVNADSFDIRKIKPYTAYDLSTDTWAVQRDQGGPGAAPRPRARRPGEAHLRRHPLGPQGRLRDARARTVRPPGAAVDGHGPLGPGGGAGGRYGPSGGSPRPGAPMTAQSR